ncbi:MAG: DUF2855 family protein [Actinobacteria bacterium]|nr:DUF2855 family protein [Actinomycetota bacterium]
MDFLVKRDDLHQTRIEENGEAPELSDGQALLEVDRFGLTANNITYGVMGDAMSYWKFFPTGEDGWGHVPMWGFARVADANGTGIPDGARVYGYLPPSSHVVVQPDDSGPRGFVDRSPHRAELPSAYQGYRRTAADPAYAPDREDEQVIFWPLFYTSWLIDDFLADQGMFGAESIVIGSASSKTAVIAAYMLAKREDSEVRLTGLTSQGNREFVEGLGVYDATVTYDEIGGIDRDRSVYVDMSGDGEIRRQVHELFGDSLAHSCVVGASHWDRMASGRNGDLQGPKPEFFFAPNRVKKRGSDWGAGGLDERVTADWHPFVEWAAGWLRVKRGEGPEALRETYLEVLDGKVPPAEGNVICLPAE